MDYFKNKDSLSALAHAHADGMEKDFAKEIAESAAMTKTYTGFNEINTEQFYKDKTVSLSLLDMKATEAIAEIAECEQGKMCVLNFASYKEPGGMFLQGSSAQEESLCHASYLYNVLKRKPEYYAYNNEHKNRGMYTNRALYTPNMPFFMARSTTMCDVLTCAAPNYTAAEKYCGVTYEQNAKFVKDRINFVLSVAADNHADILILGAFGCGVFGQPATVVASAFIRLLDARYSHCFSKAYFAIPDRTSRNFQAFNEQLTSYAKFPR